MLDSYVSPIDRSLHQEIHRMKLVLLLQRENKDEESDVDCILAVRILEDEFRADLHPLGIDIMMEVLRTSLDLTRGYGSYLLANALLEDTEYNAPRNAAVALSLYCLAEELGVTKAKKAAQKLKKKHGVTLNNTLIRFMLFSLITAWKKRSFERAAKEGTSVALLGLEQEEEDAAIS